MRPPNDPGPEIAVLDGDERYFEEIRLLCEARFGEGYLSREEFARWMRHPRLIKTALADGRFAGFTVMLPADTPEIMRRMGMPEEDVVALAGERPALIYKSAAVRAEYENCGVMRALASRAFEDAKALGYGTLFGAAWAYDGKIPIEPTLLAFGFRRLYERKMLWYHDKGYRCIVCGGPCRCDAVIYYKIL